MSFLYLFLGLMVLNLKGKETETSHYQEFQYGDQQVSDESSDEEDNELDEHEAQKSDHRSAFYKRHSREEIKKLEEFFKICQRPHEGERLRLAKELGTTPRRVKFWFQNRRTQMKKKHNQLQHAQLKENYEKLQYEYLRLKEAMLAVVCPNCGATISCSLPTNMPQTEENIVSNNTLLLNEQINPVASEVQQYNNVPEITPSVSALGLNMHVTLALAETALQELSTMAMVNDPLWFPIVPDDSDSLDLECYLHNFTGGFDPRPLGVSSEATRGSIVLPMNASSFVQMFMNVDSWSAFFSDIVSWAETMEVLSLGRGCCDGAMQVISAEYQLPSPLVPCRRSCFLRYCKQQSENRTWVIVDVSMDAVLESTANCKRRPSGCIIEEMMYNLLKVTWVEHVELDDSSTHNMYKLMVRNGMAFGARRWLNVMAKQCDLLHCLTSQNQYISIPTIRAKSVLKLAERMAISYYGGTTGNPFHSWIGIYGTGDDDVHIRGITNVDDPGKPTGVILSASTSFQVAVAPKRIFDFFHSEASMALVILFERERMGSSRSPNFINIYIELRYLVYIANESIQRATLRNMIIKAPLRNTLFKGENFEKLAQIAIGENEGNSIGLFHIKGEQADQEATRKELLLIQESYTDMTGPLLIYTPLPISAMNMLSIDADSDKIPIVPSGFVTFPDGPTGLTCGSLMTLSFQFHADSSPMTTKVSAEIFPGINAWVKTTVDQIKNGLLID